MTPAVRRFTPPSPVSRMNPSYFVGSTARTFTLSVRVSPFFPLGLSSDNESCGGLPRSEA